MVSRQTDSLVGEYAVEGKNDEGDFYEGKATISGKGSGIRSDGTLEGSWGSGGSFERLTPYRLVHAGSLAAEAALTPAQAAALTEPRAQQAGVAAGRLDGKLIGVLQVALLDSFTLDTMRQMTRIYLNESLDAIAGGSVFSGVTFNLIAWAERNGRLLELLNGATTAVPGNARLKDCAASIRPFLA